MSTHGELTQRQKNVLRSIVRCFIESAEPVGSEQLARRFFADLSPATIRNVMAELNVRGYIEQPHTSAGRVPTDKGYREYVDNLMQPRKLSKAEKETIEKHIAVTKDAEEVLQASSRILSNISHQLSVVSEPYTSTGVLKRVELVSLSSSRVLAILTMKSGLVKTITMEVQGEVPPQHLENVSAILNQRMTGLTLKEIRETFTERVKDLPFEDTGLIRLLIYSSRRLFEDIPEHKKLYISGTKNILDQPEFKNAEYLRNIFEILDNEELIVHVLEQHPAEGVSVTIGSELRDKNLEQYSLVVSTYRMGDVCGTIGLLGPKRMNYAKAIPLVEFTAQAISRAYVS